jgi:hypothetical protein
LKLFLFCGGLVIFRYCKFQGLIFKLEGSNIIIDRFFTIIFNFVHLIECRFSELGSMCRQVKYI